MKNLLSKLQLILMALVMMACQSDEANAMPPADNNSDNGDNKTLIVYYSYTKNTEQIVEDLKTMINADVIEVEPANKNLDYAANNYAIGTEQLNKIKNNPNDESSYPAIETSPILSQGEGLKKYNTIIIRIILDFIQLFRTDSIVVGCIIEVFVYRFYFDDIRIDHRFEVINNLLCIVRVAVIHNQRLGVAVGRTTICRTHGICRFALTSHH